SLPEGADPIAMAYAGHQFGSWNPQLGDGRALLIGEVLNPAGERFDIHLKGSGRTPWSRGGDGRAALGPVLREYIVSEAMAAMGIPTSRTLMAVTTGMPVFRDGRSLPGAVLARVARSHIRIGTVEFFASRRDEEALRLLADHVIARHYPEAANAEQPYFALFDGILQRQAKLVAKWQCVGFIHGVMNTDNMLLSGETIDYGPCAFMDDFDPATKYSSIDEGGRYAYRNQPAITHWNLACLAQALLPIFGPDQEASVEVLKEKLNEFARHFEQAHQRELNRKLGLADPGAESHQLGTDLFQLMAEQHSDFTLTFRRLAELANPQALSESAPGIAALFEFPDAFASWLERWRMLAGVGPGSTRPQLAEMLNANPVYIPRNHRVEAAIRAAVDDTDFGPFNELVNVLKKPYDYQPGFDLYATPPLPEEVVPATFCGT
ncbi:MAG TPA: YdiU family protein, partial [Xanthomonadales bacterium]|nr:YdiU family protein [Xanthomonadales bacterium]